MWGIGRVTVDGTVLAWPVSQADIDDEAKAMTNRLAALGVRDGGLVLLVSLLSQAIHVVPFEQAAGRLGARYSSADATPFDAFRTVSLVRQLHPTVVAGIDARVCDGIEALGHDLGSAFAGVGAVVAADADAAQRLTAAGLPMARWARLGPTSAMSVPGDGALTYDADRWEIDDTDGELRLTNRVPRLTPCDRFGTGARGRVPQPGQIRLEG